jgi:hypothetical protein
MAVHPIASRVDLGFRDDKALKYAPDYLAVLRENMRNAETAFRRTTILLVLLAASFELLSRGAISEVSGAGLKLSDLSILHKILPALVAYVFFELCSLINQRTAHGILHDAVMKQVYPSLYRQELVRPLRPVTASVFNDPELYFLPYPGRAYKAISYFQIGMVIVCFVGFLAFQLYAFNQLRIAFGFKDLLVCISFAIAFVFSVTALLITFSRTYP